MKALVHSPVPLTRILLLVITLGSGGCKSQGAFEPRLVVEILKPQSMICQPGLTDPSLVSLDTKARFPNAIVFVTEGSSFNPVVIIKGSAQLRWIWDDGTESNLERPRKDFGSRAQRVHRLHVEPWSGVQRINLGFDAQDGGDPSFEWVADQEVSAVHGLEVVSPYLEYWFSSYNRIESLDFSHFHQLRVVEAYQSKSLKHINLTDTPSLKRLCIEESGVTNLDVSGSPALEDLRSALNGMSTITLGPNTNAFWHLCVRDNPKLGDRQLVSHGTRFPQLAELYIWTANQTGTFALHSTHPSKPIFLLARTNSYTELDLVGALRVKAGKAIVNFSFNALERVKIHGCVQIGNLNLYHNRLSPAAVDSVLAQVNAWNTRGGTLDLRFNAPPTAEGQRHTLELEARDWKVEVDDQWGNKRVSSLQVP